MRNSRANNQTGALLLRIISLRTNGGRRKGQKILPGYGKWTHYSFFVCFYSRKDVLQLQAKLEQHQVEAEDSVRFYPLCAVCVRKVETVGGLPPAEGILFVIQGVSKSAGLPNRGSKQRPALRSTSRRNGNEDRNRLHFQKEKILQKGDPRNTLLHTASGAILQGQQSGRLLRPVRD